jgi:Carboxypeptidase regulatory-like domain
MTQSHRFAKLAVMTVAGLAAFSLPGFSAECLKPAPAGATALEVVVDYPLFEPEDRKLLVTINGPVSREAVIEADPILLGQSMVVAGLTPGPYTLGMLRPGFTLVSGKLDLAQDVAAGSCQQVKLELKGAQTISGTLFDSLAKPIPSVQMKLSRAHDAIYTTTDARGHFTFRQVTPGPYWISTGSDGFAEQFYPVVADQDEANVIYVKPGEDVENVQFYVPQESRRRPVSVRILGDDGSPVPHAKVALQPARGEDRKGVEVEADDQGRAEFQAFAETPYVVTATDGQGLSARATGSFEIAPGVAAVTGTVQLHPVSPRTAAVR